MSTESIVYRSTLNGQTAELEITAEPPKSYRLRVDGVLQSQVCLNDPTVIEFDYARYIARALDGIPDRGERSAVFAHLGGGALTLPRYVAATRRRAVQYVVESEAERTADLLGILPLPAGSDVRLLFGDARAMVESGAALSMQEGGIAAATAPRPWSDADATVVDLWAGSTVAAHVASRQFYAGVAALMAPDGLFVTNLIDGPGFVWSRRQAATIATLFEHTAIVVDPRMLTGPLIGNVLVFGSNATLDLLDPLASDPQPPTVLRGGPLLAFIDGAAPVDDREATDPPPPTAEYFAQFTKSQGGLVGTLGDARRHID